MTTPSQDFYPKAKLLELLLDVRADYVGTLRDDHGLRRLRSEFDPANFILVRRLDEAIEELKREREAIKKAISL